MLADLNTCCDYETADPGEEERVGVGERFTDILCIFLAAAIVCWRLFTR